MGNSECARYRPRASRDRSHFEAWRSVRIVGYGRASEPDDSVALLSLLRPDRSGDRFAVRAKGRLYVSAEEHRAVLVPGNAHRVDGASRVCGLRLQGFD